MFSYIIYIIIIRYYYIAETDKWSYVHVLYPTAIFCHLASTRIKDKPLEENAILPHTETKKPAYLFIFN